MSATTPAPAPAEDQVVVEGALKSATVVEVKVDPYYLRDQGWFHEDDADDQVEQVLDVVRRWHDEHHPDAWKFCTAEPCADVRRVAEDLP